MQPPATGQSSNGAAVQFTKTSKASAVTSALTPLTLVPIVNSTSLRSLLAVGASWAGILASRIR